MFNKERNFSRGESILMVLIIAVLITAFSYSASITVINPHSGSIWHQGYTYTIKWTKSGNMNENVKIRLYQGSTKILGIVDSTPNDGSYDWTIPVSIPNGSYKIRVKTIDNQVYDDGEIFTISERVQPKLTMLFPLSGEKLKKDRTYKIRWKREGEMSSQIAIKLYKQVGHGVSFVMDIVSSYTNNLGENFYLWRIPLVIENGEYVIRINALGENISTESGLFSIDNFLDRIEIGNNPASNFLNLPDLYIQDASVFPIEGTANKTEFKVKVGNKGLKGANNVKGKLIIHGPENYSKIIEHTFPYISKHRSVEWKAEFYFKKKGRYIFTYNINESRNIREKRYDNNKIVKTILTKALPDLIVCVDDKKEVKQGNEVTINFRVKNIGEEESCGRCILQAITKNIVNNPTLPPNPGNIFYLPPISPGGSRVYSIKKRWALPGVRKVYGYINCTNPCMEKDKKNNSVETYVKVVGLFDTVHHTGKIKCSNK